MSQQAHWEQVYRSRADHELSWFQPHSHVSLDLIDSLEPQPRSAIDVGGGQSALAGALLARGFDEVVVLDIADAALARGRARLGAPSERVRWLVADVLDVGDIPDLGPFDLWHDRAVYHFLTAAEDRHRYHRAASRAVVPGGHLIVATFAPSGPQKCSGLPVCRYAAQPLASHFLPDFELVHATTEQHVAPWGTPQDFTYVALRRV